MLNPAVTWLGALTLAFLASSSTSLAWLAAFCALSLLAIALRVRKDRRPFPRLFIAISLIVIVIRIGFRVVFGASTPSGQGWQLPMLQLQLGPLGEVHFFGFISVTSLLAGLTDGLRLAAIILSVGMASTLVSARTLLRYTPAALYELSTAVAISVNLAPQLVKSLARVQRARQLRGRSRRVSLLASIVIPVLEDTIDQSLALAASMDSRGFGYLQPTSRTKLRNLLAAGFVLITVGIYLLLTGQSTLAFVLLGFAIAVSVLVGRTASINSRRSVAHPLIWNRLDKFTLAALIALVTLRAAGWWAP